MAFSYGTWSKQSVFACAVSGTTYYMGLLTESQDFFPVRLDAGAALQPVGSLP